MRGLTFVLLFPKRDDLHLSRIMLQQNLYQPPERSQIDGKREKHFDRTSSRISRRDLLVWPQHGRIGYHERCFRNLINKFELYPCYPLWALQSISDAEGRFRTSTATTESEVSRDRGASAVSPMGEVRVTAQRKIFSMTPFTSRVSL